MTKGTGQKMPDVFRAQHGPWVWLFGRGNTGWLGRVRPFSGNSNSECKAKALGHA